MKQKYCDPMGAAIEEYHRTGRADKLIVRSSMFDDDEIPVNWLFRAYGEMPELERLALDMCRGRVLDVGAGAGCHTLTLESNGLDVVSVDISRLSTDVRRERGAKDARCIDIFDQSALTERFDTILLLMNGLGIAGKLANLPTLLLRCKELLADGGRILTDSCDLRYIFEDEDGIFEWDESVGYYGEVDYQMVYQNTMGKPFNWVYVDFDTLCTCASDCGLMVRKVRDGEDCSYLAELSLKS